MLKRPMLAVAASEADLRAARYPMLISAKLDGVRALCIERDGKPVLVSRKLIEIPNRHTQRLFARPEFVGLDGELTIGPTNAKNLMQATTSGVMTMEGEPHVVWNVFDSFHEKHPYHERAKLAKYFVQTNFCGTGEYNQAAWLPQYPVHDYESLCAIEEEFVNRGFEGAILRDPRAPYKEGRSTLKQGWMLKVKRFEDDEAEVIGTYEQMRNENEATTDELGYTKRSHHKAGKVASGVLGALRVRGTTGHFKGVEFEVGTGFTAEQRRNLWAGQQYLIGKLISYKHFPIGIKDKPRFPTFKAFRDRRDT